MRLDEARDYLLSKPAATEDMPFGLEALVFRVDLRMLGMRTIWRFVALTLLLISLDGALSAAVAQASGATQSSILQRSADPFQASSHADPAGNEKGFRTRQALLLSGVAVSMLAYGIFALRFNNSRTDAEKARLAYEADVRDNAQYYVDQGIPLDELETYHAWENAYTDAANARELITVAGLSAFLLGLGAILDAATAGHDNSRGSQVQVVTPVLGVSPAGGDVMFGARIGL